MRSQLSTYNLSWLLLLQMAGSTGGLRGSSAQHSCRATSPKGIPWLYLQPQVFAVCIQPALASPKFPVTPLDRHPPPATRPHVPSRPLPTRSVVSTPHRRL